MSTSTFNNCHCRAWFVDEMIGNRPSASTYVAMNILLLDGRAAGESYRQHGGIDGDRGQSHDIYRTGVEAGRPQLRKASPGWLPVVTGFTIRPRCDPMLLDIRLGMLDISPCGIVSQLPPRDARTPMPRIPALHRSVAISVGIIR
ncbi:hypothetical protein [Burkholderia cepacia]|uniref:hypothetical protein n=1 Tax=Burkholderia cepacia TaxID=292 RepID=UPI00398E7F6F